MQNVLGGWVAKMRPKRLSKGSKAAAAKNVFSDHEKTKTRKKEKKVKKQKSQKPQLRPERQPPKSIGSIVLLICHTEAGAHTV